MATHNTILPLAEDLIEKSGLNADARATMSGDTYGVIITPAGGTTATFWQGEDEESMREKIEEMADVYGEVSE